MDLARFYKSTVATERHIYEIIRQDSPCRLYFDLEFKKCAANAHVEGDAMVNIVIHVASLLLMKFYGVLVERSDVLQLDSSTDSKYSCHLIFRFRGQELFENNRVCGVFVQQVFSYAREHLTVFDKDGKVTSFIDLGVYTRNRAFRLPLACKYGGKGKVLTPKGKQELGPPPYDDNRLLELLERALVCPHHASQTCTLATSVEPMASALSCLNPSRPTECDDQAGGNLSTRRVYASKETQRQEGPVSEFPLIRASILQLASKLASGTYCPPPAIRSSNLDVDHATGVPIKLIVNFERHRFCQRIGRPHKSNNVFWVYDFEGKTARQGCYDSECRGWLSQPVLLDGDR